MRHAPYLCVHSTWLQKMVDVAKVFYHQVLSKRDPTIAIQQVVDDSIVFRYATALTSRARTHTHTHTHTHRTRTHAHTHARTHARARMCATFPLPAETTSGAPQSLVQRPSSACAPSQTTCAH